MCTQQISGYSVTGEGVLLKGFHFSRNPKMIFEGLTSRKYPSARVERQSAKSSAVPGPLAARFPCSRFIEYCNVFNYRIIKNKRRGWQMASSLSQESINLICHGVSRITDSQCGCSQGQIVGRDALLRHEKVNLTVDKLEYLAIRASTRYSLLACIACEYARALSLSRARACVCMTV